ncbi:MAG: arsenosugar biosynthesis radical SAM (seleno)protein ArsS [Planctomycetota bacterium]
MKRSLQRTGSPLALPIIQRETLADAALIGEQTFESKLDEYGIGGLCTSGIEILQINVGKVCNQTCTHCHVDAGPDRKEAMSRETAEAIARFLKHPQIHTFDITGGAPEMNDNFRWLVEQASKLGKHIIDRCNLTILLAGGYTYLPEFLAEHRVEIVASLPCYLEENCDAQRGNGVFKKSIRALQLLNDLGYGKPESDLRLCLVYNPVGTSLPPEQSKLEEAYRQQLLDRFGIEFTQLYTITNMPISRYLDELLQSGKYEAYMDTLIEAFNPSTADVLMCRNTLSVDWEGYLFDCDFNQMLDLPITSGRIHLADCNWDTLNSRPIAVGNHCFGCTAGAGSSCLGAVT